MKKVFLLLWLFILGGWAVAQTGAQTQTGAVSANTFTSGFWQQNGITAPSVSPVGSGIIYFDKGLGKYQVSENAGAYTNLVGGGGSGTVTGSGTANTVAKWTASTTLGNAALTDNGTTLTYTGTSLSVPTLTASNTSNQIVLGTTTTTTITAQVPGASRVLTLGDPGGPDTIAYLAASQAFTNKTITAPIFGGTATGTYTLGGTPTISSPSISSPTLTGTVAGTPTWGSGQTFPTVTSSGNATVSGNLGVGGAAQAQIGLQMAGTVTATGGSAFMQNVAQTLAASANGDTLYGVRVLPTISVGALTGTNAAGYAMPQVSGAANNTNLLVGTTSVPSGQYNVYSPSTRNNYIAGNVGLGQVTPGAQLEVDPAAAGTVGVLVKAAASQTADIAQFQNSSGTNLVQVTSAGNLLEAGVRVANRAGTYITPGSFFTGTVLGSTVYGDWTPGVAVTLARINVRCLTAGSGQTTGTQFQVTDGVTASTATLINAASGTATFSQNYAAGTVLNLRTGTSDGVAPQNCNIVASFTYQ